MTDRLVAWGPVAVWAAVLFLLSAMPGLDGPRIFFPEEDLVFHCLAYAILGAALARARSRGGAKPPHTVLATAGILYGLSDEWHQSFVPGRHPSASDFAADTTGVVLGYWITSAILAHRAAIRGPAPLPPNDPGPRPE